MPEQAVHVDYCLINKYILYIAYAFLFWFSSLVAHVINQKLVQIQTAIKNTVSSGETKDAVDGLQIRMDNIAFSKTVFEIP